MARRRMAGSPDYKGRLNAVASQLLDDIKGTDRYTKSRFIDEVFPESVTADNADEVLMALAPRTKVTIKDGVAIGGDAILDDKGRVNMDAIPTNPAELSSTAPDAVNTDADPAMDILLNPGKLKDGASPKQQRAATIGRAMQANDPAAYKAAGMPISVTDEAAHLIAEKLVRGKNNTPLRSNGFVKSGGVGTDSRAQILIPGTDTRFVDADKATQSAYLDQRRDALVGQWLRQGGASIANPSTVIVPPGKLSHMDHVQSLSSSIDTLGPDTGWGYSDSPTNYSYLDEEANVHSKLNYTIGVQHQLMKLADKLRKEGRNFPPRLTREELSNRDRKRLSGEEAMIRLATSKAEGITEAGENLLTAIQIMNGVI